MSRTAPPIDVPKQGPARRLLFRTFGRPRGVLGRVGGLVMARTNREMAERCIGLLEVQPGHAVLELGFGPGVAIELLARAASAGKVVGVDPSQEMHRQAAARNAEAIRAGRVRLDAGSATALPYAPASFDRALALNTLQLWPDRLAGLREVHRVLKPEGRLVLGFTHRAGQARDGLEQLVSSAGFDPVRQVDFGRNFALVAER
jgi:ubiquinone/menaquinone biosynthesis C-methylase UbiE